MCWWEMAQLTLRKLRTAQKKARHQAEACMLVQ